MLDLLSAGIVFLFIVVGLGFVSACILVYIAARHILAQRRQRNWEKTFSKYGEFYRRDRK